MLVFEFEKTGTFVYVPHTDVLRAVERVMRRAGIRCGYSAGFKPHISLYFSPPPPVGVASVCERCACACDMDAAEFLTRFNAAAPDGLRALRAERAAANANPAAEVKGAEYLFKIRPAPRGKTALPAAAERVMAAKKFVAEYEREGRAEKKDIRPLIYAIKITGVDTLTAVLAAGDATLRADRFINALLKKARIGAGRVEITRVKLFRELPARGAV